MHLDGFKICEAELRKKETERLGFMDIWKMYATPLRKHLGPAEMDFLDGRLVIYFLWHSDFSL